MIHRDPESVPPLFPRPPDTDPPKNDAAPLAGGAGVNGPNTSPDSTLARLPLMPPVRNDTPETSRVAAGRIAGHAKDLRARVLAFIVRQGPRGATDDDGEPVLGIRCSTYTPRRNELVELGLVVDSGRRRNTASGRPAAVWVTPNHTPQSTEQSTGKVRLDGAKGGAA